MTRNPAVSSSAVYAYAALRVVRGEASYVDALQAAIWRARFQPGRTEANRCGADELAFDANLCQHLLDCWIQRATEWRTRSFSRIIEAIAPLIAARAPSAELLAAAHDAAGSKSGLTDLEIRRAVEKEVHRALNRRDPRKRWAA